MTDLKRLRALADALRNDGWTPNWVKVVEDAADEIKALQDETNRLRAENQRLKKLDLGVETRPPF